MPRPRTRLLPFVLALVVVTLAGLPTPMLAAEPTVGPPIGSLFTCVRPVSPPRCTSVGDGLRHHVAFDVSLTEPLRAALRDTMATDYDATDLILIEDERVTAFTDVIAFSGDYGENGAAGWVYCPTDAPQGANPLGDRWCRHQELYFNLNPRYVSYLGDDGSRAYVACHELGHTVGLRHWGNPPVSSEPPMATCMNADTPDGPTDLSADDVARIDAYTYSTRRLSRQVLLDEVGAVRQPRPPRSIGWAAGVQALEVEHVPSLAALVVQSDAVVLAHIAAVERGRTFDRLAYAAVTLEVADVIAGTLGDELSGRLTLEVPLFGGAVTLAALRADVGRDGVFFMRNKGVSAARSGVSSGVIQAESRYWRLMTFDAAILDVGGVARGGGEHAYLARMNGHPFADAVAAIANLTR